MNIPVKKRCARVLRVIAQRLDRYVDPIESITITTHAPKSTPPEPVPDWVEIRLRTGRRVFGYVDSQEPCSR